MSKIVVQNEIGNKQILDDELVEGSIRPCTSRGIIEYIKKASPQTYTEEEVEIGKWVDGKPLYRKSIMVNELTYALSGNTTPIDISDLDVDIVTVDYTHTFMSNDNGYYIIPQYYYSNNDYWHVFYSRYAQSLYIRSSKFNNFGYAVITIEYTKKN